jgi:cation transport ATPase
LARVVNANLAIAVLYNVVTVSLAVAGFMTPLLCAVLMPLSSVSTVLATTFQLGGRAEARDTAGVR